MQLRLEALERHLSNDLSSLYIVHGDEHLLVQEASDRIRNRARLAGFTNRTVFTVERGFDWSLLLGANQSISLFGDRQLVEVRIPSGKPGKDGAEALRIFAARAADNSDVLTIVTLPYLDAMTQKATWFGALVEARVAVRIYPVERAALPNWIGQRLSLQQQRVASGDEGRRTLQFLVDRVEGNLLAAHQEILKLGLLYPPGVLGFEQIQDAVLNVARYNVYQLNEAMLAGDVGRLVRVLDFLRGGLRGDSDVTLRVLWTITDELRTLLRFKRGMAAGKPLAILIREHRVWGPRERLIGSALLRVTEGVLEHGLVRAAIIERQVKGLMGGTSANLRSVPVNPWDGLLDLAMIVAGR
jgi:DNA polymerase III subunit delta